MNSAFVLAVLIVVALFPFGTVIAAAAGRDIRRTIISRLGLSPQAARDVNGLIFVRSFAARRHRAGSIFLLVGAIGIAATSQIVYEVCARARRTGVLRLDRRTAGPASRSKRSSAGASPGRRSPCRSSSASPPSPSCSGGGRCAGCCSARSAGGPRFPLRWPPGCTSPGLAWSPRCCSPARSSPASRTRPFGVLLVLLSYLIGLGVCLNLGAVAGRM